MRRLSTSLLVAVCVAHAVAAQATETDLLVEPCQFDSLCVQETKGLVWFGATEALFARYYRTDGVRVGTGTSATADERAQFEFNISPRVTLGFVGPGGLGFRGQWWEYGHVEDAFVSATTATPPAQRFALDAYTVDLEIFEAFTINSNWSVELSGGARHSGFKEQMMDNAEMRLNRFNGIGPIVGIEGRRRFFNGQLYGRLQAATLFGDKLRDNSSDPPLELSDTVHSQFEISVGYRAARPLGSFGTLSWWGGVEATEWLAVSSSFNQDGDVFQEDEWVGDSDVGFASFVFGLGVAY